MGHALQSRLEGFAAERSPDVLVDRDPVAGGVKRLLRQMDRTRADVLVRVKADLLEHARERRDLHFAMAAGERRALGPCECVENLHRYRSQRVGVVVDVDRAHVSLLLVPVEAVDVKLCALVQVDGFFVQEDRG